MKKKTLLINQQGLTSLTNQIATSWINDYMPTLKHLLHSVTCPAQHPFHSLHRNNELRSNHIEAQQGTPSIPNEINSLVSVSCFALTHAITRSSIVLHGPLLSWTCMSLWHRHVLQQNGMVHVAFIIASNLYATTTFHGAWCALHIWLAQLNTAAPVALADISCCFTLLWMHLFWPAFCPPWLPSFRVPSFARSISRLGCGKHKSRFFSNLLSNPLVACILGQILSKGKSQQPHQIQLHSVVPLSVCAGVARPDREICGTGVPVVSMNAITITTTMCWLPQQHCWCCRKLSILLDRQWAQPMDVDSCTAVASNNVPLVDQAFITTKHAVKTDWFLNIWAVLLPCFFFLLLPVELVASDWIHHGSTVVLPLTSELHVTGNMVVCNLVAWTEA